VTAQLEPRNEVFEMFLNDDFSGGDPTEEALVARARRARAGEEGNYGTDAFGLDFNVDGVLLEHSYLAGEPSVTVDLDNFTDIITELSAARRLAAADGNGPHHPNS